MRKSALDVFTHPKAYFKNMKISVSKEKIGCPRSQRPEFLNFAIEIEIVNQFWYHYRPITAPTALISSYSIVHSLLLIL